MKNYYFFLILSLATTILTSCLDKTRIYEKNVDFEKKYWDIDSFPTFTFTIPDAAKAYNIYWNVRNTAAYPYRNLYITYYLEDSLGTTLSSALHDMTLFDPKTGEPYGDGFGGVYDHQFLALPQHKFSTNGTYLIKLKQYMRTDSLPEILSVGVRIEETDALPLQTDPSE
jgi:gliding motility-associated lipoprotein GldH